MQRIPSVIHPSGLGCLLACLVAAACGSTGSAPAPSGEGARITFRDHRTALTFALVDDTYLIRSGFEGQTQDLRRAAFHSVKRDENAKVLPDEVLAAVIQLMDERGLARLAAPGAAPLESDTGSSSLEIAVGAQARHTTFRPEMTRADKVAYQECRQVFLEVFNNITSFQAADPDDVQLQGLPRGGGGRRN